MTTYNPGDNDSYMSKTDRRKLGLQISRDPKQRVEVATGGAFNGKHVIRLSFSQQSKGATEIEMFDELKTSLTSVKKTADDNNVVVFTKEAVNTYKGDDMLPAIDILSNILVPLSQNPLMYPITIPSTDAVRCGPISNNV
jgi:hypothetical protein